MLQMAPKGASPQPGAITSPSRLPWWNRLLVSTAKLGAVPKHIAFIMDGNRRFAKARGKAASQGHVDGFETLLSALRWCLDLNVQVVTVYAFSVDNFGRPKPEVDVLMDLAEKKFLAFLDNESLVQQYGIKVRIVGDLTLLPERVRKAAGAVMHKTAGNSNHTLNICFSYSSGREITGAMQHTVQAAREGRIEKEDITSDLLAHCLYTRGSSPDLLIRTSGETRLSDFLVWQCNKSHLCFLHVTWPELRLWHFVYCILHYQAYKKVHGQRDSSSESWVKLNKRQQALVHYLNDRDNSLAEAWAQKGI
mmetsp:Transcript_22172/g.39312  ORF Transcript_22172/g.39312 Transcript_22172/m.39312 type:complete len:307 (-) Transcript_22172:708-1628(-)